ncbi:MAG: GTP pyrophosphokinase [Culicoidibacterales bacterium]
MTRYQIAIEELKSDLNIIDMDWKIRLGYSPIEHLKVRVKSIESIQKKLQKKSLDETVDNITTKLHDIAGARIVTNFEGDVYLILQHLQHRDDYRIMKVKDYIQKPKPSGYRSVHVLAEIEVVLHERVVWIPVEIQIRTLSMDFWAATEHKLQYKYQNGSIPQQAIDALKQTALVATQLDSEMSVIRQQIVSHEQNKEA